MYLFSYIWYIKFIHKIEFLFPLMLALNCLCGIVEQALLQKEKKKTRRQAGRYGWFTAEI
ncbi:hypothetical protein C8E01_117101 [Pontibacter virosus]|uniref:Uncharacterized protein n=1 Tax=Pontibacter virosus TaxID=1765052 RepID=A0A2U1APY8_9BACT|nr:hypothetical protein C8E01_117101 [Pontibacter virosus]